MITSHSFVCMQFLSVPFVLFLPIVITSQYNSNNILADVVNISFHSRQDDCPTEPILQMWMFKDFISISS